MVNNYKHGRKFEYEVQKYLRDKGFNVRRAYASKGIFDLIAHKIITQERFGIQVKSLRTYNNKLYLKPDEKKVLEQYSIKPEIPYEFVSWSKKYNFPLIELLQERFTVIHAYNMFPGIGWRYCIRGEWKPLYWSGSTIIYG